MRAHLHLYIDESRESKAKGGHILLITILTILIFLSSSRTFDIWTPFLHMTISNSVFQRVKGPFKMWTECFIQFHFMKVQLKRRTCNDPQKHSLS